MLGVLDICSFNKVEDYIGYARDYLSSSMCSVQKERVKLK
jgi:hypothetical protein